MPPSVRSLSPQQPSDGRLWGSVEELLVSNARAEMAPLAEPAWMYKQRVYGIFALPELTDQDVASVRPILEKLTRVLLYRLLRAIDALNEVETTESYLQQVEEDTCGTSWRCVYSAPQS